ncbi:MAG: FAD-dependent oxidoreductase [Candidatus Hydrogenedentota bacterium]
MSTLGTEERPLRVAIIGSGPSGFYAADALLKAEEATVVDMFERLPCPYGLVRLGVAPDHQKIKNVIKVYDRIAVKPGFTYYGNVEFGKDMSLEDVKRHYDAVIFANGAQRDRNLGIPGEDLSGSVPATAFVAWYNGHPDYRDLEFDFSHETAVVIGQGNVAIDVCRILCKTVDELSTTDIAQHALDQLAESKIRNVHMIGRRGPVQAKFSQVEIKEMGHLEDCNTVIDPAVFDFDPVSQVEYDDPGNKSAPKIVPIMKELSESSVDGASRNLHIEFCKSPVEIHGRDRVESIVLEKNALSGKPFNVKARGTGETEQVDCGLVLRSVGYRGVALPDVPFDEQRGVFPNENGRIITKNGQYDGLYVVGWIKRGPSGVIGTNKPDSGATVEQLLEDLPKLTPCESPETALLLNELNGRGVRLVSYDDWKLIDSEEMARGETVGKPREKYTRVSEMLGVLNN